ALLLTVTLRNWTQSPQSSRGSRRHSNGPLRGRDGRRLSPCGARSRGILLWGLGGLCGQSLRGRLGSAEVGDLRRVEADVADDPRRVVGLADAVLHDALEEGAAEFPLRRVQEYSTRALPPEGGRIGR